MNSAQHQTIALAEGRIVGYLDGVTDGALIGWIADLDHPARLQQVVCRGQDGAERAFLPFVPRQDVCDAFGITGRFGFAIPLHLLDGLGPTISLHDATGAVLHRATDVALPSVPHPAPGPRRIVLHIQKTAGTSLRAALGPSVPPGEALFIYPDGFIGLSPDELATLPEWQGGGLRLVMGHFYFGVADDLPGPAEYITFLRAPEARLRSHYFHHLAQQSLGQTSLSDVPATVSQGLTDEFDNLMVRMVAGVSSDTVPLGCIEESHVRLALHNIRTRFRFVGIVEHMDAHYPALCRALHIRGKPLPVENTCRITDATTQACRVDWSVVMRRNRFDVMLYESVQSQCLAGRALANPLGGRQMQLSHA